MFRNGSPFGFSGGPFGFAPSVKYNPFADSSLFALFRSTGWRQERTGLSATTPSGDGDPVGTMVSIRGTRFAESLGDSNRPTCDIDGIGGLPAMLCDASDDYFDATTSLASFATDGAVLWMSAALRLTLGSINCVFAASHSGGVGGTRWETSLTADGFLRMATRRLNTDSVVSTIAPTGAVETGQPFVGTWVYDYATAALEMRVNGVAVYQGSHGTSGAVTAGNSLRVRVGTNLGLVNVLNGLVGSIGFWRTASIPNNATILAAERYIGRLNGITF